MKLKHFALLFGFGALALTACNDEGSEFDAPSVTAPAGVVNVDEGATDQTVEFTVSIDADLTATYTATGVGVTVKNPSGDVSGSTLTITYDAGATGAGSITVKVTDSEDQSDEATAVISVGAGIVNVTSNITENTTWETGKCYILGGRITVVDGVTLTIEPGVLVKGQAGTGANATALLVARGGKLMAEGTAELPIIFTSVADEITPDDIAAGNFASPNLDPVINGLWGGVIVLGKARISASDDNGELSEVQIEGIPTSDPNGLYGGTEDADNSGVLKYLSIRHGGTNIGSGNEINGLTLGAVGSGTVIENIEIVSNQDDGIEWFGGTVNVSNVVVWNTGDDAIDTDQAWSGTLNNFVVVSPAGHCFELDGPEGAYSAGHVISNGTIVATFDGRVSENIINVDANSDVDLKNLWFTGITESGQGINRTNAAAVTFENIAIDVAAGDLASYMLDGLAVPTGVTAGGSSQADVSGLQWTWAAQAGGLDGL